ncbi:glycosyltransferase [Arthrobacter sp. SW1]|uniref:glycosyltransferase family protein n=1 Tax=Arthrobacter sp. SW1 TaxID=1920889 RepID=UPI00209A83D1|nr:glycosyltransferase [Arthrobacter sp. SW1]
MLWHLRKGGLRQVRQWQSRRQAQAVRYSIRNIQGAEGAWTGRGRKRRLAFNTPGFPAVPPRRADLRVAVILDEFSDLAFGYEWTTVRLSRRGWRAELAQAPLDFLFVESAWNGNGGEWKYQLAGASGVKQDFVELLEHCRANGIPTVFWNKEDPPHFEDFLPAARLFDVVFTSDSNKVDEYRRRLGHERIGVLPFAAQPRIHAPIRPRHGHQERGVAFAGMYFAHKYPERREQMDLLLGAALDASRKDRDAALEIFSRQLGGDPNYQFPGEFAENVVGSLSYEQMLTAYKAYKVFLNVNSVVDSPSMCARRIFEITASGTPVVSTPSQAVHRFFPPDEVFSAETRDQAAAQLRMLVRSPEMRDRVVHRAQRRIWREHTYSHRAEQVVAGALPSKSAPVATPSVSALVSTMRPARLEHILSAVGSQSGVDMELVLLAHGFHMDAGRLKGLAKDHGVENIRYLEAPSGVSLGECLNRCVAASGGEVLSKMDDDDYYAPHYMLDLVLALDYSGAAVAGKQAHYMHFVERNATLVRAPHAEHTFSHLVAGPTITAARAVFETTPFRDLGRGEDTAFLQDVAAAGGGIYSADRFNFCQIRSGDGHTWTASEEELMASGTITLFGNPIEHITV